MSDSNKRILLTVVACSAILLLWYFISSKLGPDKKPPDLKAKQTKDGGKARSAGGDAGPQRPAASQPAAGQPTAGQPAASQPASQPTIVAKAGAGPLTNSIKGRPTRIESKEATGIFTTRGAALRSWKLKDPRYQERKKDKQGRQVQVDLVQTLANKGPWPLETTFVAEDSDFKVPANAAFERVKAGQREVRYSWQSSKVRVTKHYVADKSRPLIWMTVTVRNLTERPLRQRLQLALYNRQDPSEAKGGFTNPFPKIAMVLCHVNGEVERRSAASIRGEGGGCSAGGCGIGEGELSATGQVLWIGAGDNYFLTAVVPLNRDESRRCELKAKDEHVTRAAMQFGAGKIEPGKALTRRFAVFIGPKVLDDLDAVTGPDHEEVRLSESINYGWFAILCRPMLWLLKLFQSGVVNWGIAIILLTLVVKLLTLYWTQKSMRSMKAMQRLKPKIDQLREKFKDDKQRLNQETMALYKVHKVNPLGGCLPMVIQMPIWFALYRTLSNSVELYRSVFIPGYLTDLTAPDPYYILPILMGIAMFGQQAISPQPMEGTQAKMMKYFMPIMFTVMMLGLPSGLTLYIFVNTVLTMIHQWYMNKTDKGDPTLPKPPKDKDKDKEAQASSGEPGAAVRALQRRARARLPEDTAERPKPKKKRKRKKRS